MPSALDTLIESYTVTEGAYWTMEDESGTTTAADASGNGRLLTTSGFEFGTAGIVPTDSLTCAEVNDNSDATCSYEPSFSAVTFGVILHFVDLPGSGNDVNILRNNSGNAGINWFVNGTTNCVGAYIGNGTSINYENATVALVAGHTYLLMVTWDGEEVTLYQYDITAGSAPTPTVSSFAGSFTSPSGWVIWNYPNPPIDAYLGRMFILPSSLTPTQVAGVASAAGYSATTPPAHTQGLSMSLL
jgi:hypothetical protein